MGSLLDPPHPITKLSTLGDRPNFQPLLAACGQLERPGERIGLRPGMAEVIGVEPKRRAVRPLVGQIRDGRLAEQLRWSLACGSARRPQALSSAISRYQPSAFSTSLMAGSNSGPHERRLLMLARLGPVEKHVAVHPDGLFRRVVRAQIAAADEQVVVETVVAAGIVVQSRPVRSSAACGRGSGGRRRESTACRRRSGCGHKRRRASR